MSVEIQTVVMCRSVDEIQGGLARLSMASIYEVYPNDGKYPVTGGFAFYVLLKKETRETEIPFELKSRIIDADGRTLRIPGNQIFTGTFPPKYRFWGMSGHVQFLIPLPGAYQIRWETECCEGGSSFFYDFDASEKPTGAKEPENNFYLD